MQKHGSFWRRAGERIFRFQDRHSPPTCWGVALLLFALALVARLMLAGYASGLPFITFFPAMILTTLLCGWRQALLVLLLACASAALLLPPPSWYGGSGPTRATVSLAVFSVIGLIEITVVTLLAAAVRDNYRLAAHEKTLFLELQHRVANTMQFVAGMLTMARQGIATPAQADAVLEQATARVLALGQLHRRLHEAARGDADFAPLLRDILEDVFRNVDVTVRVDARTRVPLSQMTPIVLLVTEAATNSAKHVFRLGRGSVFDVVLARVNASTLRLTIRDDGPGLQAETAPATSMGLRIMRGLAQQLGGKLHIETDGGAILWTDLRAE